MRRLRGSFDCQRLATVARHTSPSTRPALSASYPDARLGATSLVSLKRHDALQVLSHLALDLFGRQRRPLMALRVFDR